MTDVHAFRNAARRSNIGASAHAAPVTPAPAADPSASGGSTPGSERRYRRHMSSGGALVRVHVPKLCATTRATRWRHSRDSTAVTPPPAA